MSHHLATRIIHAGERRIDTAAIPPIFQCTVYEQVDPDPVYDDIKYPRLNNTPNHEILGAKLAELEGAESGVVTSSGMAAITTVLLDVLRGGGHVLAQDCLYGGTHHFVSHELASFGMSHDWIETDRPETWKDQLKPNTRAIYVEALSNPLLGVIDHGKVIEFAREHGLVAIIDNTFATPVNFPAVGFGYDVAVHSATKYLNGHSDLCAGVIASSTELLSRIKKTLNLLGGSLDPLGCFLLHRGVRTLEVRVERQNATATGLAEFFEAHAAVRRVHYPALETHPHHATAAEYFRGCGGVLAIELEGDATAATAMIDALELPVHAPSLGGLETLVTRPCKTSHAGMSAEERAAAGIGDGLVRISVGLEHVEDLRADFAAALQR